LIVDPLDAAALATWQEVRAGRGLSAGPSALPQPTDFKGLLARAMVFAQQRCEPLRAIADYDAAIALSPDPYAMLNRGLTQRTLGNLEQARADIAVWVKFDPQWSKVVAQLDEQIAARDK
jgi:tetratricopeptide (TPR) repeat protein